MMQIHTAHTNLLQQHQQGLEHRVGESWAGPDEVDHALEVVDEDDGQRRLVTIQEHFADVPRLLNLRF